MKFNEFLNNIVIPKWKALSDDDLRKLLHQEPDGLHRYGPIRSKNNFAHFVGGVTGENRIMIDDLDFAYQYLLNIGLSTVQCNKYLIF